MEDRLIQFQFDATNIYFNEDEHVALVYGNEDARKAWFDNFNEAYEFLTMDEVPEDYGDHTMTMQFVYCGHQFFYSMISNEGSIIRELLVMDHINTLIDISSPHKVRLLLDKDPMMEDENDYVAKAYNAMFSYICTFDCTKNWYPENDLDMEELDHIMNNSICSSSSIMWVKHCLEEGTSILCWNIEEQYSVDEIVELIKYCNRPNKRYWKLYNAPYLILGVNSPVYATVQRVKWIDAKLGFVLKAKHLYRTLQAENRHSLMNCIKECWDKWDKEI